MVEIKVTIPNSKWTKFLTGFLYIHPIPLSEEKGEPFYTEEEWITRWTRQQLMRSYKKGKCKKAVDETINNMSYDINNGD